MVLTRPLHLIRSLLLCLPLATNSLERGDPPAVAVLDLKTVPLQGLWRGSSGAEAGAASCWGTATVGSVSGAAAATSTTGLFGAEVFTYMPRSTT